MTFTAMYLAILIGTGLIVISALTSLVASRFGAPLLLVFLAIGLLAGEDGPGGIQFSDAPVAYFLGSLALAIILFDSGFNTRMKSFRNAAGPALVLSTIGVVLTAVLVGLAAHLLFGFSFVEGLLIGSIVSSTDAAAVFFLLRVGGITIRDRVRSTLEVESSSNDPMAILLTVALVDVLVGTNGSAALTWTLALHLVQQMALGLGLGAVGGLVLVSLVNRLKLEPGLYPVVAIGAALLIFAVTGLLNGSGFLAVYVAGLLAGNAQMRGSLSLRRFQEGLTWLCQIVMFLLLGLFATPSQFPQVAIQGIGLALVLTFAARPLVVWACLLPFRFRQRETAFIAWVGLRGAVSILLALLPIIGHLPNSQAMFNIAFLIVLTSLLLQGWTIKPAAQWLNLVVPPTIGPIEKVELELPGTAGHELVVYHVLPASPVALGQRLQRWARPSVIVRDGHRLDVREAGRLRPGDYVYVFAAARLVPLLDRLFAGQMPIPADDALFFGQFSVNAQHSLAALGAAYGAPHARLPDITIAEYIERKLGKQLEIGDRVEFGELDLIVRETDGSGQLKVIGLYVGEPDRQRLNLPSFMNLNKLRTLLRKWRRGQNG